ncbi:cupredoxin domain-containing protein [Williamsia muralis]|uniref:cupredoxin domain-containing protein n=1 Tax=Williamsia marianensis TaxID=85044 RepID=UPI00380ABD72
MRRAALAAILLPLTAGCSQQTAHPAGDDRPADAVVTISNIRFNPQEVHIPVGGVVEWRFDDGGLLHDVRSDGVFDSGPTGDSTFRFTFEKAGIVQYTCSIHRYMLGTVHVG